MPHKRSRWAVVAAALAAHVHHTANWEEEGRGAGSCWGSHGSGRGCSSGVGRLCCLLRLRRCCLDTWLCLGLGGAASWVGSTSCGVRRGGACCSTGWRLGGRRADGRLLPWHSSQQQRSCRLRGGCKGRRPHCCGCCACCACCACCVQAQRTPWRRRLGSGRKRCCRRRCACVAWAGAPQPADACA